MTSDGVIEHIPRGHRYAMLCASITKRALAAPKLPPAEKLELLENLNSLPDGQIFTLGMLMAINPATDLEVEMVEAAAGLDGVDAKRCDASFRVLTGSAFAHFASLSLAPAIKLMRQPT
jgi:hypothetical protein